MPDEKLRVKQGQKLNQASQNVGDPRNMAKILGVAGEGLWDFLGMANENLVPQSVEELALEGSPVGKAIGAGAKMLAGLPFAAYIPKLTKLKGGVGHGTTAVDKIAAEGIDPKRFDEADVLGWMLHAAENPEYFNRYADGSLKGVKGTRQGVLPLAPDAKNVLDLVEPNTNDLAHAIAQLNPHERMYALDKFKQGKVVQRDMLANADAPMNRRDFLAKTRAMRVSTGIKSQHYPLPDAAGSTSFKITDDPLIDNLPAAALADRLRLDKHEFAASPFDAIRYRDMDHNSWAFDTNKVPIKTTFGTEIPVQRPRWELGEPRPSEFIPDFMANPDGTVEPSWVGGGVDLNNAVAARASDLENIQHVKRQKRVMETLIGQGFEPWASNVVSRSNPDWIKYEIPRASNTRERQDMLKAFQYLYPDKAEAYTRSILNDPLLGGSTVQALVPTKKMSRIVLDK
jgi:hypothetical protein